MFSRQFITFLLVSSIICLAKAVPNRSIQTENDIENAENSNVINKGKCGGGCVFSKQCADWSNDDCRCSWFSCKQYDAKLGKFIDENGKPIEHPLLLN